MQIITKEQLTKRFQALPETLQDAVFSEKTADAIGMACQLRDVNENSLSPIATLTGRVLLGYLRPETFAFEIQKETGIDALKATQVAHDIDTEIFSEVRLELKKLYPPTIQTPTVQAQGFIRSQPVAAEPPKPAPRYVVQIPERFKKTSPWPIRQAQDVPPQQQPTTDNSQLITDDKGAVPSAPMPAATPVAEQKTTPPATSLTPQPSIQKVPPQPTSPPMDPIVPLPTFIRSKFKQETLEPKKEEALGAPNAQDALKNAFGKFTTPSTATGVTKEPASPYRETIEEPTKPWEQKPTPKIQGKVIDLSQF